MVSETDPEFSMEKQKSMRGSLQGFKEEQEQVSKDIPQSHFRTIHANAANGVMLEICIQQSKFKP